jgi:hypothetical protein
MTHQAERQYAGSLVGKFPQSGLVGSGTNDSTCPLPETLTWCKVCTRWALQPPPESLQISGAHASLTDYARAHHRATWLERTRSGQANQGQGTSVGFQDRASELQTITSAENPFITLTARHFPFGTQPAPPRLGKSLVSNA